MSELEGGVAVVVACVDCRHHRDGVTLISQYKQLLNVEHVFLRTAAGPDGRVLSLDHHTQAIVDDTQLLIDAKGASVVAVVAHAECAGHPVSDNQHREDVVRAVSELKSQLLFDGQYVAMFSKPGLSEDWGIEVLSVDSKL